MFRGPSFLRRSPANRYNNPKARPSPAAVAGYGMEILNTTGERDYDRKERLLILEFSRRIFRLSDPKISQKLKEVYEMQTIPLREYSMQIKRELDKEEGRMEGREEGEGKKAFEIAQRMLARNMSVSDIIDLTGLGEKEILAIK
jgi:predicted transposase/invertase (TIGR01784 family)